MKPRMKPRETETRMLGWHSRLRLVFAGRRVEDQIQQVCFNQFILSKTPNQRDRIAIRWISCKNYTKLRNEGTLWRFIPILAKWQRRRYDWITKDWQKDLTILRWRGNGCIIYRFNQGKNRSFRVWIKVFWARDYLNYSQLSLAHGKVVAYGRWWLGCLENTDLENADRAWKYSQLSPCGHPAITDTPIIRTAAKSPAKTSWRRLTEINSQYYGLSLMRTPPRSPYSVRYEGSWLYLGAIENGHAGVSP